MKDIILITGASSGIGYEMAKLLAEQGYHLVLVARRIEILEQMKVELGSQFKINVDVFQADLSDPENAAKLYNDVKAANLNVTMLVNNAGFGEYGNFLDIPLKRQVDMINTNVTSVMILCHLFLKDMKSRGYGKVMNIASLLAYIPFPYFSVYAATKTFVLSFTETLAAEFEGTGVEIKALCPGPVTTGFNSREMLNTNAYQSNKPVPVTMVAKAGVQHLLHGRGSKKVGFRTWLISNLPRFTPDTIMMKIKKKLASQK